MSATVVDAAQEVVDMTADPHQAHTATRGTTADTTRGQTTEWELDRLHQSTMVMDLRHKDTMEGRSWRSSRGRRLLLRRRQEMRMTAKRCGDCSARSTKTRVVSSQKPSCEQHSSMETGHPSIPTLSV